MNNRQRGLVQHGEGHWGEERRKCRQSAFDKLLHSVWGVLSILGGVAILSAGTALSAQRFVGAPAANAKAITEIITSDSLMALQVYINRDDIVVIKQQDRAMMMEHVDINRSVRRLGIVICASLGGPTASEREVRVACAALTNGD